MQLTNPAGQGHRLIDSEGQYRVAIQIEADKDAADDGQLKVGEYVYRAQPFNRICGYFCLISKMEKTAAKICKRLNSEER
jgi:hypothetical protein